jgi:hypothetical protein
VEHGVKGAGAELLAMAAQFFDNAEAKNWLLHSMVKNVEANQAGVKLSSIHGV